MHPVAVGDVPDLRPAAADPDDLHALLPGPLQDAVERDEKVKNLKKQIEVLQARIRKEKQLNVQMKLNTELKKLKKELEEKTL